jgi:molecular chaperone DnaJ
VAGIRDALLIATGAYHNERLARLRSPAVDAAGLAEVLSDPEIGFFTVDQLIDSPAHEATRAIERFFRQRSADDLLVLHLSCHGVKDDDGQLYFAFADTDPDLLASTTVPASFLHRQLDRCRAKSIVVLIDCCYSGAFLPGMKGPAGIDASEQLAGFGRAVLTATNRTEYAWEGALLHQLEPEPSRFTAAIIEGLRTGEADRDHDGRIAVDELYEYVYEQLLRSGAKQTPRLWTQLEYRVFLANSGARSQPVTTVDEPARSPTRWQRRARPGMDALIRADFSLRELALGVDRTFKLETPILCESCEGTGVTFGSDVAKCADCHGYGTVGEEDCSVCKGFGTIITDPCATCDGEGRCTGRREITARIPPGAYGGMRVRLTRQGQVGPGGGIPGDLYIEIVEKPDERFERVKLDLHHSMTIPADIASTGGVVDVDTLTGTKQVRIPAGTRPGQRIRLTGLGLPGLNGSPPGNLIIDIKGFL